MSSIRKFTPAFLSPIDETARKCFGNLPQRNGALGQTGFKFLKQKPIGKLLTNHYLPDATR